MHPVSTGIQSNATPLLTLGISPNPAHESISVKLPVDRDAKSTLQITNAVGQTVLDGINFSSTQENLSISIQDLPAGVYLLQLKNSNSRIYATGRFVKH